MQPFLNETEKKLDDYVEYWKLQQVKPVNEDKFFYPFLRFLDEFDEVRDFEFLGDGYYFGKVVMLKPGYTWGTGTNNLKFEITYSKSHIKVYSLNHNGYCVPEYLDIPDDFLKFEMLSTRLNAMLKKLFGVN